jgi:CRP-like cAMP-binding protein
LSPDPASPPDETRFSTLPPALPAAAAHGGEIELARQLLAAKPAVDWSTGPASWADSGQDDFASLLDGLELKESVAPERQPARALDGGSGAPTLSAATLAELPRFPLFASLPSHVLARLVGGAQLIELPHSAYVVRCDDSDDALYAIAEGSVTISVPGQPFELTLAEGDVFGEACLLDEARSQVDIVVHGKLSALRIARQVLLQAVQEHPPLAGLVFELLTRRRLGNLLQVSPMFQDFDAGAKAELAGLFEVRRVAAGSELSVAGKRMDGLYIALTGSLHVREPGVAPRVAPAGSMFGHNSLLTQDPSGVDVVAAVDMIVLRLPAARFTGMAMQYPSVLVRLGELSTSDVVRVII